jgi:hypothetical protein
MLQRALTDRFQFLLDLSACRWSEIAVDHHFPPLSKL